MWTPCPSATPDVGMTAAWILGLTPRPNGTLVGRIMTEAMPNGARPKVVSASVKSAPSANGLRTVLNYQRVGTQRYFDVAGFPGRSVRARRRDHKTENRGEMTPPLVDPD